MQHLKVEQTRVLNKNKYTEYNKIHSSVSTHFDYLLTYECKHQGEFFITAKIPKKGISYLPEYPVVIEDKWKSYSYLRGLCRKHDKMLILISTGFTYADIKARAHVLSFREEGKIGHFDVYCGDVEMAIELFPGKAANWGRRFKHIHNRFDNFKAYYIPTSNTWAPIEDHTQEWSLELMKEITSLN